MTTVAFLGLGIMGRPMAVNLVSAGFAVVGYSRRPESADPVVRAGGRAATSIADAVAQADVVALMLPDGPDVEAVLTGEQGVFDSVRPGTLIVDFSSISPATSRELARRAAERGLRMLDAPVSGGEAGAIEGTLSIMIGGAEEDVERLRPLFEAVGATVQRVGDHGAGQSVKAANQLIVAGAIQLVAEAIKLLEALDVDLDAALRVINGGLAGSKVLDRKAAAMLKRDFTPGFRAELHHKDLGIVTAAARDASLPLPLGNAVAQLMAALVAQGRGSLDHGALLAVLDDLTAARGTEAANGAEARRRHEGITK
ncbi:2-hydroxy-3-oxopropionate reductase [Actinomadura rayongensis]|uniref:2-hydroxy-3-oxopropionate reductase n=1 Tax=Actinomadura rayongensis TaxID=1429076 RepID=A0A6I4WF86_9ACTN|nr:2-hydroxy-3-oxopropionate reductase [Actinomadura rayongensis]MXQ67550.1 2-hydroxy-3-oxopropionate reductase [Actinomadura rayongensis]